MYRLLFLMTALFVTANGQAQNFSVGQQAPDFTLNALGGGTFSLSDYTGQVRFLDFFGST